MLRLGYLMQRQMLVREEGPLPYEFMRLLFQAEQKSTVVPEVTQGAVWVLEKCTVVFTAFRSGNNFNK